MGCYLILLEREANRDPTNIPISIPYTTVQGLRPFMSAGALLALRPRVLRPLSLNGTVLRQSRRSPSNSNNKPCHRDTRDGNWELAPDLITFTAGRAPGRERAVFDAFLQRPATDFCSRQLWIGFLAGPPGFSAQGRELVIPTLLSRALGPPA